MPDSAPEEYKELAEICSNADPDNRPRLEVMIQHARDISLHITKQHFLWIMT